MVNSAKGSKKDFFEYISNRREIKDIVRLLLNGGETLVAGKVKQTRVTSTFSLHWSSLTRPALRNLSQETRVKGCWKEGFHSFMEDWVTEYPIETNLTSTGLWALMGCIREYRESWQTPWPGCSSSSLNQKSCLKSGRKQNVTLLF